MKNSNELHLSISKSNQKMGYIPSFSFPPLVTCGKNLPCYHLCYARKITNLRKTVREAYERNWKIYNEDKDKFYRELEGAIKLSTTFRFMVSGDIPDPEFFKMICEIMKRNPHCQAFQFTKRYSFVNDYIAAGNEIPSNLHLMFSGWKGITIDNPYNLPECHVLFKDGTTTARDGAIYCSGNCSECYMEHKNCFALKNGEQILIRQH